VEYGMLVFAGTLGSFYVSYNNGNVYSSYSVSVGFFAIATAVDLVFFTGVIFSV
jgi:hypothetical protein